MTVPSIADRRPSVLSDLVAGTLARDAALVVAAAVLVGLLAQLSIPVPGSPVPVTGQTFGALFGGVVLGWRRGGAALLLYLVAGAAGVPWFAGHGAGLATPSLGYILAFPVAAAAVGALSARGGDRTPLRMIGTMAVGTALVYAIGVPYLALDLHLSVGSAVAEGLRPFLLGDAAKAAIAAGLAPGAWAWLRRRGF
ncbi:MAG TPA: biotin transporter BioY [Acidimicrobiales bacterium]|nr:biotin transporter BioY [Acidimicrobiales bacterium]